MAWLPLLSCYCLRHFSYIGHHGAPHRTQSNKPRDKIRQEARLRDHSVEAGDRIWILNRNREMEESAQALITGAATQADIKPKDRDCPQGLTESEARPGSFCRWQRPGLTGICLGASMFQSSWSVPFRRDSVSTNTCTAQCDFSGSCNGRLWTHTHTHTHMCCNRKHDGFGSREELGT